METANETKMQQFIQEARELSQKNEDIHRRYGYAFYGYWGGIILLGALFQLGRRLMARKPEASTKENASQRGDAFPTISRWLRTWLFIPFVFGDRSEQMGSTIPTRIEGLMILGHWILAIVLVGVNYQYGPESFPPGVSPKPPSLPAGVPSMAALGNLIDRMKV